MSGQKEYFGFSKNVNDYYNHYVTVADAKAGVLIAISFVLFDFLKDFKHCTNFENFLFYTSTILLSLTCLFSICTVFPRNPKKKKGLIFWDNVKEFKNSGEYFEKIKELDSEKIEKKYSNQNYNLSKLLSRKYFFIKLSIFVFFPALVSLIILYLLNTNA
ncbi:Pycsar system effector family protein [Seonamhaeicola sp.]|uniref:Pycsar system effector family protein n=1 Tax=Seonamhaeicola sp. TaxID=1912245 RepID=UPI0026065935|nr:Pycsar system effector family protein [Seonamhaeicola sp.]